MSDEGKEGQTYKMKEKQVGRKAKATVVDDEFFKLSEMSRFLDQEDQKESRRQQEENLRKACTVLFKTAVTV
jgi:U3 small nucleolar RNA-associated protein MPP10